MEADALGRLLPPTAASPPRRSPVKAKASKTDRPRMTDAQEVEELRGMFSGGLPAQEAHSTSTASSSDNKPKWNSSPLRNPPGNLRGVRPITQEPWMEVAEADRKTKLDFGHEGEWEPKRVVNSFVEEARRRREENAVAAAWDSSIVHHMPPELRGQKSKRPEPWSKNHNDDISEINAIEGTSITELYNVTADRNARVKPTIVQPSWDMSKTIGRPSTKPGAPGRTAEHVQYNEYRAKAFREARKSGAPAGGNARPKARTASSQNARTTRQ